MLRHFLGVCFGILVLSSTPNLVGPLFPLYEATFGLGHVDVGWIAALYGLALIPAMFLAGPWSDRWGRSRLLVAAIALAALSDVAFAVAADVWWLIAGRLLQGLAVGTFFGPATALASDLIDRRRPGTAALGAAVASLTGAGFGSLISGLFIYAHPGAPSRPFFGHLALLLGAATLLAPALRWEGSIARRGAVTSTGSGRDHPVARRLALVAGFAAWSVGGLLLTMLPILLRPLFDKHWALLSGIALFGVGLAGSTAQTITLKWKAKASVAVGGFSQALGLFILTAGLSLRHPALWMAGALVIGLGLASVHRGGIGLSVQAAPDARKGWAISRFLCCGFLGMNVPVIGFGFMADRLGLGVALLGYTIVFGTLLAWIGAFALAKRESLP